MTPVTIIRALEPPIFVVSVVLLVWASLPGANPLVVTFRPLWRTFRRKNYALYLGIGLLVVFCNAVLTAADHHFTRAVVNWRGADFTSLVRGIEGDWVKVFQEWTWPPLTWYMGWVYIIVFPAVVPWAMVVFDYLGESRRNISVLIGYIANYLLALPFYIFFPVRECHEYAPSGEPFVRLVLDDMHPAIMQALRPMSGIDNCFPSFHTSLTVTIALCAWFSGRNAFRIVMAVMALSIILSTLYLGVHWVTDVGAGVLSGVVAFMLGEWLGRKFWNRRQRIQAES